VLLRWGLQRGTVVIPKSERPERIRENLAAADERLALSLEEMNSIDALDASHPGGEPSAGRLLTGEFWLKRHAGQTLREFWGVV
jgi:diketogulonate reductase-like aldo/keto reductase